MTTRIYIVTQKVVAEGQAATKPRLVRAANVAQAVRHVARDYQAAVAGQDDLVKHISAGVAVEVAGADDGDQQQG